MLTQEQHRHFEAFGFIVLRQFFSPQEMERICGEFETALDALYAADPFDGSKRHSAILTGKETPFFAGLPENPRLYGIAEQLYGECFPITSDANRYVGDSPWHPDHSIDVEKDCYGIKFAYYLDPVGPESGALRVIPGSHRNPFWSALDKAGTREAEIREVPGHVCASRPGGPGRVRRAPVARQLRRRRGQAHVHARLLQESGDPGRGEGDALAGRALRRGPGAEAVRQPALGVESGKQREARRLARAARALGLHGRARGREGTGGDRLPCQLRRRRFSREPAPTRPTRSPLCGAARRGRSCGSAASRSRVGPPASRTEPPRCGCRPAASRRCGWGRCSAGCGSGGWSPRRPQRAGDRGGGVDLVHLEAVDPRVVADGVMGKHLLPVAAGYELHAAVFHRRILQGEPDAETVVLQLLLPVCLVLVPRGGAADSGRLDDGVLSLELGILPEQAPADRRGVGAEQGVAEPGVVGDGVDDLGQASGPVLVVGAGEIVLVAFLPSFRPGRRAAGRRWRAAPPPPAAL